MSLRVGDDLRSEIGILEAMLARIPAGRVIQRAGLMGRVARLREELARLPPEGKRLDLTFRGEPVEGSRSIVAEFAGRALAAFSEAVATIAASFETDLGPTGRLPGNGDRSLRIVGPALGSFGFEMEIPPALAPEPQMSLLPGGANPMELAVELAMTLIEVAQDVDEERLSDVIADVHPRAAGKVREFVRIVVDRRATFNVRMGTRRAGFVEIDAGRRMLDSLRAEDVTDESRTVEGQLWVLPHGRQFELKVGDKLLKGRLGRSIADPSTLPAGMRVEAQIRETSVRAARPRYTLMAVRLPETSNGPG